LKQEGIPCRENITGIWSTGKKYQKFLPEEMRFSKKYKLRVKIFKIFSPPIVLQIRTGRILRG